MAKGIKYFFIGLTVLLITGWLILTFTIDSIVKSNIESVGTQMAGTPVTVDDVSISVFSGEGSLTGFRIANPDGYSSDYAVVIDDFHIELDIFSLWSDVPVIREIRILNPSIYVEQQLPDNNLMALYNHFNEVSDPDAEGFGEMIIEYFLMDGGTVDLYTEVGGERSARVEMSTIEIQDIGEGGGEQYAKDVVREIADQVIEQALQAAGRSGGEQLRDAIEGLFR